MADNLDDFEKLRRKEILDRFTEFLAEYGIDRDNLSDSADDVDTVNLILLDSMLVRRCIVENEQEVLSADPELTIREARNYFLRHLWNRDMLDSPWRALVDREFPGSPPTSRDFERYAGEAAEEFLFRQASNELVSGIRKEVQELLDEHNYLPVGEDEMVLMKLAVFVGMFREPKRVKPPPREHDVAAILRVAEKAVAETSDPDHPVWPELFRRFFTA